MRLLIYLDSPGDKFRIRCIGKQPRSSLENTSQRNFSFLNDSMDRIKSNSIASRTYNFIFEVTLFITVGLLSAELYKLIN